MYTFTFVDNVKDANNSIVHFEGTSIGRLFGLNCNDYSPDSTRLVEIDSINSQILFEYSLENTGMRNDNTTVYYITFISYQNNFFLFSSRLVSEKIVLQFKSLEKYVEKIFIKSKDDIRHSLFSFSSILAQEDLQIETCRHNSLDH